MEKTDRLTVEAVISTEEQLSAVMKYNYITDICIETGRFSDKKMQEIMHLCKMSEKNIYFALPHICRENTIKDFETSKKLFVDNRGMYAGFLVRNYEEYIYFAELMERHNMEAEFIFDSCIYIFNNRTLEYIYGLGEKYHFSIIPSMPYELNAGEISELSLKGKVRMEIYGHVPVMISAGCVKKTEGICDGKNTDTMYLKDRMKNSMPVITYCRYCYNAVLNSVPLYLGNDIDTLKKLGVNRLSVRFTAEDGKTAEQILSKTERALSGSEDKSDTDIKTSFTRGHFRRGVL